MSYDIWSLVRVPALAKPQYVSNEQELTIQQKHQLVLTLYGLQTTLNLATFNLDTHYEGFCCWICSERNDVWKKGGHWRWIRRSKFRCCKTHNWPSLLGKTGVGYSELGQGWKGPLYQNSQTKPVVWAGAYDNEQSVRRNHRTEMWFQVWGFGGRRRWFTAKRQGTPAWCDILTAI